MDAKDSCSITENVEIPSMVTVGATTELEIKEKVNKSDDSIHANIVEARTVESPKSNEQVPFPCLSFYCSNISLLSFILIQIC